MALLQRYSCLSSCCSTSAPLERTGCFSLRPQRAPLQLQTRTPNPQLRFSVCRASSENRSSADVALHREEEVFKDESTGVVCYNNEEGDVTCEGLDEGPHFQPDPLQPALRRRQRFPPSSAVQVSRGDEAGKFVNVKGRMAASLGEVANESLECSEL